MYWERLTSHELNALDKATPLFLSIAAVEQHGPHLATGTDSIIGAHLLERLEAERPDGVVILPQVKVGCSEHHMSLGGTLTVSHPTFIAYVTELASAALRHGFTNLVILNSHGGNVAVGGVIAEMLAIENPDCRIVFTTWWRVAAEALKGIVEGGKGAVGHACEFETSLMMSAAPGEVRGGKIPPRGGAANFAWADGDMLVGSPATLVRTMSAQTGGTGVKGEPSLASAGKGVAIADAVVAQLVVMADDLASKSDD
ncbi:creatininase [Acuticoccus sediminis]|uniref:Creatininase n=1 Tax=Acuticoccus sediminis TaxID=2184697 RepID=A0A8B2NW55_9HYPH|nr:creatininase family protein [Acuticoccus sediminis]RAI02023.1 creatininase [Acuticoccus sediminis]